MYHVTNVESAKKIAAEGASSKQSQQQENTGGGFFLWTNLDKAKDYTTDPYIESKSGEPFIVVFDIPFNTRDFDIDYEISGGYIAKWVAANKDKITSSISSKLGSGVNVRIVLSEYYSGSKPVCKLPPTLKFPRGKQIVAPDSEVNSYSNKSGRFLSLLAEIGLLDEMENSVVEIGAPAVKYMGSSPIFPSGFLDKNGNPMNLESSVVKEAYYSIDRWKKLAGLLKG